MKAHLARVSKIWDAGAHQAFTSLVRFRDHWYCIFREASGHVSNDGQVRILSSSDGIDWKSVGLLSSPNDLLPDLRDPKIIVTADHHLVLVAAAVSHGNGTPRSTYLWRSANGEAWSDACPAGDDGSWLWSLAREGNALYSASYTGVGRGDPSSVHLYQQEPGRPFTRIGEMYSDALFPNEAALVMNEGRAVAIIRREFTPGQTVCPPFNNGTALLGTSTAPYTDWETSDLGLFVGGPALLRLPSGKLILSGRTVTSAHYTAVWEVDLETRSLRELLILPSGNDCSYPGLVWEGDRLWISYYSGHEGKTSIYFAEVAIEE